MGKESEWVTYIQQKLKEALVDLSSDKLHVDVESGKRLSYANEILQYDDTNPMISQMEYETDLLIFEKLGTSNQWTPRIVIEAKYGQVTTHDALVYSTKAATHKQVHPYLRYGIIIGGYGKTKLPPRLVRHGAYFDFMIVFEEFEPTETEWSDFVLIVNEEIDASQTLQKLLTDRTRNAHKYKFLHRPLILK